MEVQNIAGPDFMPSSFSIERPQLDKVSADNIDRAEPKSVPLEQGKGESVDTYA